MANNLPSIDALLESFNRVYHGPDDLRREYDLVVESEKMGVPLDIYRRLYELRGEEPIAPYPKPQKWWHIPREWGKCMWHLPPKKKLLLSRKGIVSIIQNGAILTIALALGQYFLEAPERVKQSHYQAWQMINSARGQTASGGRIDALQDLVRDGVNLQDLDAPLANLSRINLAKANLSFANFSGSALIRANLSETQLVRAKLIQTSLWRTNLTGANLSISDLSSADLHGANLSKANFSGANFGIADSSIPSLDRPNLSYTRLGGANITEANFRGAKGLIPEQIKAAKNWQSACYDPDFRKQLGLPPENPKNCAGE